ncbi:methyltransferase domain-containing protein [Candidatus Uhrbacteria bacterium]|nr:methyltransferase domain-containing protein [Candidatus Uhrbacteria bacterium]
MRLHPKYLQQEIVNHLFSLYCSFNNRRPHEELDPRLSIRSFTPTQPLVLDQDDVSSPSRILSNAFWRDLPWDRITQELGELRVLDTGCGSGSYGDYLNTCSNGKVKQYVGLDVYEHPSWSQAGSLNKRFHRFNGKSIAPSIPEETNFFMSQSAIEHFQNDKKYFSEIRKFIKSHPRPILQVHLFPSVACLKLYGRHGYRQYTPRTVSRITRMFPDSQCVLFALGGSACNQVHDAYITQPLAHAGVDERKTKSEEYRREVINAILQDKKDQTTLIEPSFWALVICSHWKRPLKL